MKTAAYSYGADPLSLTEYSPAELLDVITAGQLREERLEKKLAVICYQTAVLMSFAFHAPHKMPPFEKAFAFGKKEDEQGLGWQRDKARLEAYRAALNGRKKEK